MLIENPIPASAAAILGAMPELRAGITAKAGIGLFLIEMSVRNESRKSTYLKNETSPEARRKTRARFKRWYEANKSRVKKKNDEWWKADRSRRARIDKAYVAANKDRIRQRQRAYNARPDVRQRRALYQKARRGADPAFRAAMNLRGRLKAILRAKIGSRFDSLIGCSRGFLKDWLGSQFRRGMNWENYGRDWHIDHIVPCSAFDLSDEQEQRKCFHYTNLRPLWKVENLAKGNRIIPSQPELLFELEAA